MGEMGGFQRVESDCFWKNAGCLGKSSAETRLNCVEENENFLTKMGCIYADS